MAVGSAISGLSSYQNAQYQAAVASNNAKLLEEQAKRETFAANQDIADQDMAARAEIAEMIAQMNASGLSATTGTMIFRRAGGAYLANRDRERLSVKRDVNLENTKRQAATMRAEARALRKSAGLGLLIFLINIPTSFLSGASMVNEYRKGRMALDRPSYSGE
jgi:hypothetical protein